MKKNIFKTTFQFIGKCFKNFFMFLAFCIAYILIKPFIRCKIIGKQNISKTDDARVFIANHYEIYGPLIIFLRFPYKFRPWVIDKMTSPESVEKQMSLGVYSKFPKYPMWLKKIVVKTMKNFMVFSMNNIAKAIPVSRENPRSNIKTMQESVKTFESGKNIVIWPELSYVEQGVGEFQTGFEHIAKYYYQKTNKKISFYPVFISQIDKKIYIDKPIIFNPENDPNDEKIRITNYLHDTMKDTYINQELNNPNSKRNKKSAK